MVKFSFSFFYKSAYNIHNTPLPIDKTCIFENLTFKYISNFRIYKPFVLSIDKFINLEFYYYLCHD